MPTKFNMTRDINGYNGFGIPFSLDGESMVLAAGVAQSVTVPNEYPCWIAIFGYTPGATVWVDGITTAVAPTGAHSATTSRLNPAARFVRADDVISFITEDLTSPMAYVEFLVCPPFGN
jgi:hypothetical protein